MWQSHTGYLKLAQHCESTLFQLKKKKKRSGRIFFLCAGVFHKFSSSLGSFLPGLKSSQVSVIAGNKKTQNSVDNKINAFTLSEINNIGR